MKKDKKAFLFIFLAVFLGLVIVQCDNNDIDEPALPEISYFHFDYENTDLVDYEVILKTQATIIAEATIDKIMLEIKPKGTTLWAFDSTYQEFSGLNNVSLYQDINIPFTTDSCMYTITLTVIDGKGNQVSAGEELVLTYMNPPVDIPFEYVNGFIIDASGTKILATDKGLFALQQASKKYYKVQSEMELLPVNDLAQTASSNDLWIGSNNGVLNVASQLHLTNENSELLNNMVNRITIDNNQVLYFATPDGISIKRNEQWLNNFGLDNLYLDYPITDIATASNGYTYATTNGGGVERFKVDVDGITGATVFDTDWSQLKSNTVYTVFIDDTVQAYGTDNGVAIHYSEYTKWDWETYTTFDGLVNDRVLSIIKDNSGNWWFGTMHGLSKLTASEWTSYSVENDGIISDTVKFMSIDIDGSLWIASDKGLSQFYDNQWINY